MVWDVKRSVEMRRIVEFWKTGDLPDVFSSKQTGMDARYHGKIHSVARMMLGEVGWMGRVACDVYSYYYMSDSYWCIHHHRGNSGYRDTARRS